MFSNLTKTYASLTQNADFFGKVIPASLGKEMEILDDNKMKIMYFLDKKEIAMAALMAKRFPKTI